MECMPPGLEGRAYYQPTEEGREKLLRQRMMEIAQIRKQKKK
jgi:putative ATPase